MARKTVLVSDLSGEEIPDGKGATVTINFRDARKGVIVLDVTTARPSRWALVIAARVGTPLVGRVRAVDFSIDLKTMRRKGASRAPVGGRRGCCHRPRARPLVSSAEDQYPVRGTADSFSLWQLLPRRLAARGLARQFDACFFECGSDRLARGCAGSPDLPWQAIRDGADPGVITFAPLDPDVHVTLAGERLEKIKHQDTRPLPHLYDLNLAGPPGQPRGRNLEEQAPS